MAKPRICLLAPRFPPDTGGVSRAAWRLASHLHSQQQLAWVVAPRAQPPFPWLAVSDLRPEHIAQAWAERPWNLIHAFYPSLTAAWAQQLQNQHACPLIYSARGNDIDRDIWNPQKRQQLLPQLGQASALTGVSRELQRKLAALCPQVPSYFIANSVDTQHFQPQNKAACRQALKLPETGFLLGFVGEARQKKGWSLLLNSFAQLAEAHPALQLIVAGRVRSGPDQQLFQIWSHQHAHLRSRLHCFDEVAYADLPQLFNALDLLVQPSFQDGMANAALEAMACGTPVLASAVGGFPDIIQHQQHGLLVAPYSVTELVNTLNDLLLQPDRCQELGRQARQLMLKSFQLAVETDSWQSLYTQLLD